MMMVCGLLLVCWATTINVEPSIIDDSIDDGRFRLRSLLRRLR